MPAKKNVVVFDNGYWYIPKDQFYSVQQGRETAHQCQGSQVVLVVVLLITIAID